MSLHLPITDAATAPDEVAPYDFEAGTQPMLLSIPHGGTALPADIANRLTSQALRLPDTDWHLDRLYDFSRSMGISVLRARYSRYVVDLNRPPDDADLYPGQDTTGLCPLDTFQKAPLYLHGTEPDAAEIVRRREAYWAPYHQRLRDELQRLRSLHPRVVLWDAHSIRSHLPRFFSGTLPDFNFGTADGHSCADALAHRLLTVAEGGPHAGSVLNGRFKGGYITRTYGRPQAGVHAVQLELAQSSYMNEDWPYTYRTERAARLQLTLQRLLLCCLSYARSEPGSVSPPPRATGR